MRGARRSSDNTATKSRCDSSTSLARTSAGSASAMNGWTDDLRRIASVPGASEITGMARLPSGNLLVLDGPSKRLLELDAVAISDAASGS